MKEFFGKMAAKKPRLAVPEKVWSDPLYFFAFGFGSGAMPFAPGTFGTLMAIPFYLILRPLPVSIYIFTTIIFIIISIWASKKVSEEIGIHDHPGMCIDEFAGFFVTMINAPFGWEWVLLGFVLFRFFDIVKPFPISYIDEHIHGGVGMILDDVAAGFASFVIIQILVMLA